METDGRKIYHNTQLKGGGYGRGYGGFSGVAIDWDACEAEIPR